MVTLECVASRPGAIARSAAPGAAPRSVIRGEFGVCVDWVAFSYLPVSDDWKGVLRAALEREFGCLGWEPGKGWQGYEQSARCGAVLVAWGGAAQQGTVHVEVSGSVCGVVSDWSSFAAWVASLPSGRLTRVDLAFDDFRGAVVSVDWALAAYHAGDFAGRGSPPSLKLIQTFGRVDSGSTVYVGKRENGKLLRVYEKGKQLGACDSPWVRCEVEWRAKDRVLDFDMLLRPAEYLAGAFPPLSFISLVLAKIRTFKVRAEISFNRAVEIARLHAGRVVNAILVASLGDVGRVVDLLRRDGFPARLSAAEALSLCPS